VNKIREEIEKPESKIKIKIKMNNFAFSDLENNEEKE